MMTLNWKPQAPRRQGVKPWRWSPLAAGVLLGCALTLSAPWLARTFSHAAAAAETKGLADEFGSVRLTIGRLGGQAAYAPYPTSLRSQDAEDLRRLCRGATSEPASPTAESLQKRALCALAGKRLDAAVTDLESATQLEPANAVLLSDLSALYGERAAAEERTEDYAAALEIIEKAVALDPKRPEIVFNRAVALEHLFLRQEALAEWRLYLELDQQSPWAEEAKTHVEQLSRALASPLSQNHQQLMLRALASGENHLAEQIAAERPQEAREVLEDELLPSWAFTVNRQEEQAKRRLMAARVISRGLVRRGGDSIFLSIFSEMEKAAAKPPSAERANFIEAVQHIGLGQQALRTFNLALAMREFKSAERTVSSLQSPMALLLLFYQARCYYFSDNSTQAQETLLLLGKNPLLAHYPSLEARRQWLLGMLAYRNANQPIAIRAYLRAHELLSARREQQNAAMVQLNLSEAHQAEGRPIQAWRALYQALSWCSSMPGDPNLYVALNEAVLISLQRRQPRVALLLQSYLVRLARIQPSSAIAEALLRRARIEAALGHSEDAKRDFEQVRERTRLLRDDERKRLAASIEVAKKEIDESEDRPGSIARDFSSSSNMASLDLMDARSDFNLKLGNADAAEEELERDMEQLETQRAQIRSACDRRFFFDRAHLIYEKAIALNLNLGHPDKALEILERSRGRLPLDQFERYKTSDRPPVPLRAKELTSRLPPHTVIIVYGEVQGRLITWLIRSSGVQPVADQSWRTVEARVQQLREKHETVRQVLVGLYHQLVDPAEAFVGKDDRIIFIPTNSLYEVPFAALVNADSGRYLIQDHTIGIAPSASEFIAAVERDRRLSTKPPTTALLVGNPSSPELPMLPGIRQEIDQLSGIYREPGTQVLMGEEATPERVLASIDEAEIVHFSVHGVQDAKDPNRSRLLLSSAGDKPGVLLAQDVLRLHIPKTRLVMLAACDTQAGSVSPSEGSLSLSSAFLAAGVPAVVGTLRPVEDEGTVRLSIRFHQELRDGADALSALRTAQLDEIARQHGSFDWTWASFQVLGGVVERGASLSRYGEREVSLSLSK